MPNTSYLIQRLKKPYEFANQSGVQPDEVFGFGGGYLRGGLSKEAFNLCKKIWSWDYMGAAQFEFGAVPRALNRIAQAAGTGSLITKRIRVDFYWMGFESGERTEKEGEAEIFLICPDDPDLVKHAEEVIRYHAKFENNEARSRKFLTKEPVLLSQSLALRENREDTPQGWLELDNGFLFFIDEEMYKGACRLFGVKESSK